MFSSEAPVYVSTGCLRLPDLSRQLETYLSAGLSCIELSSGLSYEPEMLDIVRRYSSSCTFLVHNYFPPVVRPFFLNLASANPDIVEQSLAVCRTGIELTSELGGSVYSVHAGCRADIEPSTLGGRIVYGEIAPYHEALERFVENVQVLADLASRYGVAIAIEPNVITSQNLINGRNEIALLCEPWEVRPLLGVVDRSNCGLLLDTGHLQVTSRSLRFDSAAFLREAEGTILAIHAHENDGTSDQHLPVTSDGAVRQMLEHDLPAQVPLITEARYSSTAAAREHVSWLADLKRTRTRQNS